MSKMPAKKKSCFQITSVTQAQVAASSITDDTESLDDPDESRTEDVSSEIFDVSRADFEPEVCDRSSSDETINNVGGGESEAHGVLALHIPQEGQLPAVSGPPNGGFAFRSTAVAGVAHVSPHALAASAPAGPPPATVMQQSAAVSAGGTANVTIGTSQPPLAVTAPTVPAASTTTTTASCSSRFRVIKLDHGTGEPFRRGRWTCTEFYDKDTEGSSVISRTVDSAKPAELTPERDSGLGATGSSVVTPSTLGAQGGDSSSEASGSTPAHLHQVDPQQQGYGIGHQPSTAAFQPPAYAGSAKPAAVPLPVPAQPQVQQPPPVSTTPQTLLPPRHNGAPLQKSPSMPPATQSQPFPYPAAHHQPSVSPVSQLDYRPPLQQPQHLSVTTAGQTLPMGPLVSQGPSPIMTPLLGLLAQSGESVAVSLPGTLPPVTTSMAGGSVAAPSPQQLPSGLAGMVPVLVAVGAHSPALPGVQNVPSGSSSTPLTLPSLGPSAAGPLLQGARGGPASSLGFASLPSAAAAAQLEANRRKSDALPQPSGISGKDVGKPLVPESLQLPPPSVNSLFGIPIPLDGDEDR